MIYLLCLCTLFILVFEFLVGILYCGIFLDYANNDSIISNIKEYIEDCFEDKNVFGYILNILVIVLLIPAWIVSFILLILACIYRGFKWIWRLGERDD